MHYTFWRKSLKTNIIDILWCIIPFTGLILVFPQFLNYCLQKESFVKTLCEVHWLPEIGFNLCFLMTPESLVVTTLIFIVSTAVFIYTIGYIDPKDHKKRKLQTLLLFFMINMLCLVTVDHMIGFFVFWELTSLTSYLLIGYYHEDKKTRDVALQALLITGAGGLILLAGLILLGLASGVWNFYELGVQMGFVYQSPLFTPLIICLLIGSFTKSAQVPFHFWLPKAMVAPTPVSAYLHSATMVKAGVFLLIKLNPYFSAIPLWTHLLGIIGTLTFLVASSSAYLCRDLKQILAYTTLANLGLITLACCFLNTEIALFWILGHGLYKAAAFMVAGNIGNQTGTRDLTKLSNILRTSPVLAGISLITLISMLGISPSFMADLKKHLLANVTLPVAYELLIMGFGLSAGIALLSLLYPLIRKTTATEKNVNKLPLTMVLPPLFLSLVPLFIEISFSEMQIPLKKNFLNSYTTVVILGIGFLISLKWKTYLSWKLKKFSYLSQQTYDFLLTGLYDLAKIVTNCTQNGYLRFYLVTFILATSALVFYPLTLVESYIYFTGPTPFSLYEALLCIAIVASTFFCITTHSRLGAVTALGVVGYCISLFYLCYGAPDLSMTQFLVDTLFVLVFVLVFYHLPKFARFSTNIQKARDAVIALTFGLTMGMLVLSVSDHPLYESVSYYLTQNAQELAKGKNVVSVILVDYRALDTLGESLVLALAGIGVYGFLRLRLNKETV